MQRERKESRRFAFGDRKGDRRSVTSWESIQIYAFANIIYACSINVRSGVCSLDMLNDYSSLSLIPGNTHKVSRQNHVKSIKALQSCDREECLRSSNLSLKIIWNSIRRVPVESLRNLWQFLRNHYLDDPVDRNSSVASKLDRSLISDI